MFFKKKTGGGVPGCILIISVGIKTRFHNDNNNKIQYCPGLPARVYNIGVYNNISGPGQSTCRLIGINYSKNLSPASFN